MLEEHFHPTFFLLWVEVAADFFWQLPLPQHRCRTHKLMEKNALVSYWPPHSSRFLFSS